MAEEKSEAFGRTYKEWLELKGLPDSPEVQGIYSVQASIEYEQAVKYIDVQNKAISEAIDGIEGAENFLKKQNDDYKQMFAKLKAKEKETDELWNETERRLKELRKREELVAQKIERNTDYEREIEFLNKIENAYVTMFYGGREARKIGKSKWPLAKLVACVARDFEFDPNAFNKDTDYISEFLKKKGAKFTVDRSWHGKKITDIILEENVLLSKTGRLWLSDPLITQIDLELGELKDLCKKNERSEGK